MDPFEINPEMVDLIDSFSDEDLISFAELYEGSGDDEHIELSIYSDFAVYRRTHSSDHYNRAVMRAEGWVAITPNDLPDRKRRLEIFDTITASRDEARIQPSTTSGDLIHRIINAALEADRLALFDQYIEEAKGLVESTPTGHHDRVPSLIALMIAFRFRYMASQRLDDMENFLGAMEQLIEASTEDSEKVVWLKVLAVWYNNRFEQSQDTRDLERVVETTRRLVQYTPANDSSRFSNLARVGMLSHQLFMRTNSRADLDRAIEATSLTWEAVPPDHPGRYGLLSIFGKLLQERSDMNGSSKDAERALEVLRPAMKTIPPDDPARSSLLVTFSQCLFAHFERTDSVESLNSAVDLIKSNLEAIAIDATDYSRCSDLLGSFLLRRFERTGALADLQAAKEATQTAIEHTPQHDPCRPVLLSNFGSCSARLFEQTGEIEHLNSAIAAMNAAIESSPPDSSGLPISLSNLSTQYIRKYERSGEVGDINLAIDAAERAWEAMDPRDAGVLFNLANGLYKRFERLGEMEDLHRAIDAGRKVVDGTRVGGSLRPTVLSSLATWIAVRFDSTQQLADANEAIELAEEAVRLIPSSHHYRSHFLNNLATVLSKRYQFTGELQDLNRAITVAIETLDGSTGQNSFRWHILNNLGAWLYLRSHHLGTTPDLDRAIGYYHAALDGVPLNHPDRPGFQRNLAECLSERFRRAGRASDLDKAIDAAYGAANGTPTEHVAYGLRVSSLASLLQTRFQFVDRPEDSVSAINILQKAVNELSLDNLSRPVCLGELARALIAGCNTQTVDMKNLENAIEMTKEALDQITPGSSHRAEYFWNIACMLGSKWRKTQSEDDEQQLLDMSMAGWNCTNALPSLRIDLGGSVLSVLIRRGDWKTASKISEEMVRLIPIASPRLLENSDKQRLLQGFTGQASYAASIALNAKEDAHHALQLLEQGRSVITGILMGLRTDILDLKQAHPDVAQRFETLRDQLDTPMQPTKESDSSIEDLNQRHNISEMFDKTLEEIRSLSGFENFFLPPTADEMMAAADRGPLVVVNANVYRSDAIIVESHRISVLNLPNLHISDLQPMGMKLRSNIMPVLEWLWNVIASPILDYLGFQQPPSDDNWPHVWWIPVGTLSFFPLHAAGKHFGASRETVIDRVMSSYSLSVKAHIYGRQQRTSDKTSQTALLVSMPQTPGQSPLPSASKEISMLRDYCHGLNLSLVEPAYPTKERVLGQLKGCKIFHFAGHGLSDPAKPSESSLIVHDWQQNRLTVGDLRDLRLHEDAPFLSYLSACSTNSNRSGKLIDEGINLVNACQLAGFRHVVGTLWEVSDEHCVEVARVLYQTLQEKGLTDDAVCLGLHRAIRHLRNLDGTTSSARAEGNGPGHDYDGGFSNDDAKTCSGEDRRSRDVGTCSQAGSTVDQAPAQHAPFYDRNAVPKQSQKSRQERARWYWVPYVHFGA